MNYQKRKEMPSTPSNNNWGRRSDEDESSSLLQKFDSYSEEGGQIDTSAAPKMDNFKKADSSGVDDMLDTPKVEV